MNNLTTTQQELIEQITNEFVLINKKKNFDADDIFAYIDSAVNEQKLYVEEMKKKNELYDGVVVEKIFAMVDRINEIVSVYGFDCSVKHISRSYDNEIVHYANIIIASKTAKLDEFYLYTNTEDKKSKTSYIDTDIEIYRGYMRCRKLEDGELNKYIADKLIIYLKSQIK